MHELLTRLIRLFYKPIVLIFILLVIVSVHSLARVKLSLLPSYTGPEITVETEYFGMDAECMEDTITVPIENILKEIDVVRSFRSYSTRGKSRIVVELERGEDPDRCGVIIKDRIYHIIGSFPPEVREPAVYRYSTEDSPFMILSLSPSGYTIKELRSLVERVIEPGILAFDGVARVETGGLGREDYFIDCGGNGTWPDYDVSALFRQIARNNVSAGMGFQQGGAKARIAFTNRYRDIEGIRARLHGTEDAAMPGRDLFTVVRETRETGRFSAVDGSPALTLSLYKTDRAGILRTERKILTLLRGFDRLGCTVIYDQADEFRRLLWQLRNALFVSAGCIVLIAAAAYGFGVLPLIFLLTVPLCGGSTILLIRLFGKSLNVMTLSGIIAGIGICVDNTIIVLEERKNGTDSGEFGKTHRIILASTLTTLVVFIPLVYSGDEALRLYREFAFAFSCMLISSYVVSILFVPSFLLFFRNGTNRSAGRGCGIHKGIILMGRKIRFLISGIVRWSWIHPRLVLAVFFTVVTACAGIFFTSGSEDISPLSENTLRLIFQFDPGYNERHMMVRVLELGREIMQLKPGSTLLTNLEGGRATFFLRFPQNYRRFGDEAVPLIEKYGDDRRYDGFFYFPGDGSPDAGSLELKFFGNDLEELSLRVKDACGRLLQIEGVNRVLTGQTAGEPEIELSVRRDRIYRYGMDEAGLIRSLRYVFYAPVFMKVYEEENITDVRARVSVRGLGCSNLDALRIPGEHGARVPLDEVCELRKSTGRAGVSRENGKRYIPVDISFRGIKEKELAEKMKIFISGANDPANYCEFDERYLQRRERKREFIFLTGLALYLVFTVLGVCLRSVLLPVFIMLPVPALFSGTAVFLLLSGHGCSIPVYTAFIMVLGLSVNSTVLLIEEYGRVKKLKPDRALLRAFLLRTRTISLTTATTFLSCIPVFLFSTSSVFFRVFTGVTICGVLMTAIVLPFLLPAGLSLFGEKIKIDY